MSKQLKLPHGTIGTLWKRSTYCFFILSIFMMALLPTMTSAQNLPAGFARKTVANGMANPVAMAVAPDGRIFVCEQYSGVRVIKNEQLLPTSFIKLNVPNGNEQGVLGIALDPNFTTNGYVYIYHTKSDRSRNRLIRVTANGDVAVSGSQKTILEFDSLSSKTNHNGGAIQFGKDGKIYVAIGDNANSGHAQNLNTYHGKMLRINPDGSAPTDNPFYSSSASEQKKRIWAYGLRNPYTFDIQPGTGKIFVNDVGDAKYEEINDASVGGRNFGWPYREGYSNDYTSPIYAYANYWNTGVPACAIAGGAFFNPTSTNWSAEYKGRYFFLDYCDGKIMQLIPNGSSWKKAEFATNMGNGMSGMTVGKDGDLYYVNVRKGEMYKIYSTASVPPTISGQPSNATVAPGKSVSFSVAANGSGSLQYQWKKDGGTISGATSATYTIASVKTTDAGNYSVTVSNSVGSVTSNTATLIVSSPPVAKIITPIEGTTIAVGTEVSYSGEGTDLEDGTLPASAFTWEVRIYHGIPGETPHYHDFIRPFSGVKSGTLLIEDIGKTAESIWYRFLLTVTDSKGATHTTYRDVYPRKTTLSFTTEPAGLKFSLEGSGIDTPAKIVSNEGVSRTISGLTQTFNGVVYTHEGWKHGGELTQKIVTPTDDISYTAIYKAGSTNLAYKKPVTVTSVEAGSTHIGSNAVDGDPATRWASQSSNQQSIYVDLGNTYDINFVKINWEKAFGKEYKVEVSDDLSTWNEVYSTSNSDGGLDEIVVSNGLGLGRYLKITGKIRATQYGYSIWELEVYGKPADGNVRPTASITAPANGAIYTTPATVDITATATDTDGTIAKVDFYNGTTLLGSDTTRPFSYSWVNAPVGSHSLTAVATDDKGATGTSAAVSITVSAPPGCDAVSASSDDGNVAANVLDKDPITRWSANGDRQWIQFCLGSVQTVSGVKIAFFKGNERQSRFDIKSSKDEGLTWDDVATGLSSSGTSLALENFNITSLSTKYIRILGHGNSVNTWNSFTEVEIITGGGTPNVPPTVSISSPANGTSFSAPAAIAITANAADTDGKVTKVDFYNGTSLLGSDTVPPFSFNWSNVAAGTYTLKAVATDDKNASTTSSTVTVTVTGGGTIITNLALNKTTTTSTGAGANAVDGNTDPASRWSANNFPQWIEVDLGAVKSITKTEVIAYKDRAYKYKISAATTVGGTYTPIVDRSKNSEPATVANPNTNSFAAVQARYVRIHITGATGYTGTWAALVEFRVFGISTLRESEPVAVTPLQIKGFPNPYADMATVEVNLPEAGHTTIELVNIMGAKKAQLHSGYLEKGTHQFNITENLPSGIYFCYVVQKGNKSTTTIIKK